MTQEAQPCQLCQSVGTLLLPQGGVRHRIDLRIDRLLIPCPACAQRGWVLVQQADALHWAATVLVWHKQGPAVSDLLLVQALVWTAAWRDEEPRLIRVINEINEVFATLPQTERVLLGAFGPSTTLSLPDQQWRGWREIINEVRNERQRIIA